MKRTDAEVVFGLVAEIGGDLRGKVVSERWWLVWILMGAEILITCSITQLLIWSGETRLPVFVGLWGLHVALIPPIIFFVHRRAGGQRTATETYVWWIWATFILCGSLLAVFNHAAGLPLFFTAPVLALLAAFAFSMMAMITARLFLLCAALFLAVMVAMSLLPSIQFLIYGTSWFAILVGLGLYFRATLSPHPSKAL